MRSGDICSIYLLTNTVNNKVYVGQTWLPTHIRMGRDGSNYKNSIYLYNAIQKHGADKFQYEVLIQCRDQEVADSLEEYFINQYNSRNLEIGYNLKEGGSAGKHSDETKKKISETLKAQAAAWTPEELVKRSAPIVGWWTGKERGPHTENWKEENSTRTKEWHANNVHPMSGRHHSEEAKLSMSQKNTGRKIDPEIIKKRSLKRMMDSQREQSIVQSYKNGKAIADIEIIFQTGRSSIYRVLKRNNITTDSGRNSFQGKEHSEETKQKMAEARKKYWENKRFET